VPEFLFLWAPWTLCEHNALAPLIRLIEKISRDHLQSWGICRIRRDFIKPITNEAFLMTVRPALEPTAIANVFYINAAHKKIYIVWLGDQRAHL